VRVGAGLAKQRLLVMKSEIHLNRRLHCYGLAVPTAGAELQCIDRFNGFFIQSQKNWIAHLILAGVVLALVLDIGNLPGLLANYFIRGQYDKKAVAAIVLAVLLYYFMKLGNLLTSFVDASRLQQSLLRGYLSEQFDEANVMPLNKSTNFFVEAFFSVESFTTGKSFWPYLLVTCVVVSVAQAAALFLVVQAYDLNRWLPSIFLFCGVILILFYIGCGKLQKRRLQTTLVIVSSIVLGIGGLTAYARYGWSPVILLLSVGVMIILYILFWSSQKDHPQTTLVVVSAGVLAVFWLIIFAATGR
jgi:hypothetical protein